MTAAVRIFTAVIYRSFRVAHCAENAIIFFQIFCPKSALSNVYISEGLFSENVVLCIIHKTALAFLHNRSVENHVRIW